MMHSCASAAKLRGGGPILFLGMKAKGDDRDPATSNRHRHPLALEAGRAETVGRRPQRRDTGAAYFSRCGASSWRDCLLALIVPAAGTVDL